MKYNLNIYSFYNNKLIFRLHFILLFWKPSGFLTQSVILIQNFEYLFTIIGRYICLFPLSEIERITKTFSGFYGRLKNWCDIYRRWNRTVLSLVTGYSKPRLECPKDVVAELPPGRDEAFVTFDQPATDLDWFRYVRSKPSWGTRLEANLEPGVHEVTFFARHPVSKKQASCVLRIIVKGN